MNIIFINEIKCIENWIKNHSFTSLILKKIHIYESFTTSDKINISPIFIKFLLSRVLTLETKEIVNT